MTQDFLLASDLKWLMLEGVCLGVAWLIIIIWAIREFYGFRDKKRNSVQEVKK